MTTPARPRQFRLTSELYEFIKDKEWDGRKILKYARFCNDGCRESYAADRRAKLIYSQTRLVFDDGADVMVSHDLACRFTRGCPYCGAETYTKKPREVANAEA